MKLGYIKYIFIVFLTLAFLPSVFADTADEIQAKIDEHNKQIQLLQQQIEEYNTEVNKASTQAATLQSTLKTLDLTKKKISTDINLTQNKIVKTTLTITQLGSQIDTTKSQIDLNKKAISSALQNARELEDRGVLQVILSEGSFNDIWTDIDTVRQTQNFIQNKTRDLATLEGDLEGKQNNLLGQKKNLVTLQQDLTGKKQAVEATTQEKATLLAETKDKEQTFQALLTTKRAEEAQFEKELNDFEAQLHLTINIHSYPAAQHGILSWPLDNAPAGPCDSTHKLVSCIVRGFYRPIIKNGVTIDPGHNGVDFRASIGTKVISALDGIVAGTGNTDIYRGCYGLGKWVMVNHPNGLSTIYMHLSVISVGTGQSVQTGDLVGLSGNTGNSQAPHLHVSVYATQGVEIRQFTNSIGCKQAVVPLADPKAYLDPLTYFPSI